MRYLVCLLAVCICLALCGCDLWMAGEYYSTTPHLEENAPNTQSEVVVSDYEALCNALESLVNGGIQERVLYTSGIEPQDLDALMGRAIAHVTREYPIGAYAVETVQYEAGTNAGRQAVAVNISYIHNRSEILRIKSAENMTQAQTVITDALAACDAGVVLLVDTYEDMDFGQMVQDYVDMNPQTCMEMPQVTAAVYPEQGSSRVVELSFTYQTSRDTLREMQQTVAPVFASAELYVSGDAESREKYAQLYSFLMERYDYKLETSITPSYSLLRHGVGDSKAFATVYAAMCRQAGLDCQVVAGTKAGEAWNWNVILEEESYYYVDLLECSKNGSFRMLNDAEMTGYVWDYSAYTAEEDGEDFPVF